MTTSSPRNLLLRKLLFAGLLALIVISAGLALFRQTPFITPASERARPNPLATTPANLIAAKPIYSNFCANCHGDTGKGLGASHQTGWTGLVALLIQDGHGRRRDPAPAAGG